MARQSEDNSNIAIINTLYVISYQQLLKRSGDVHRTQEVIKLIKVRMMTIYILACLVNNF